MSTEKFENFAQANLKDYRSTIDAEALWLAIEPVVKPQKRRGFFWLWLLAGLLSSATALYLAQSSNHSNPEATETSTVMPVDIEKPAKTISPESASAAAPAIADVNDRFNSTNSTPNEIDNKFTIAKTSIPSKNTNDLNTPGKNQNNSFSTTPSNQAAANIILPASSATVKKSSTPSNAIVIPTNEENINANQPTAIIPAAAVQMEQPAKENEVIVSSDQKTEEEEMASVEKIEIPTAETTPIEETEKEKQNTLSEIISETAEIEKEKEELAVEGKSTPPPPPAPRFWRKHSIGFGVRAGIGNSITTLSTTDDFGRAIRVLREDSETKLESLDFGLDVLLKSNDHGYYLSTGVDYQRSARRLNFDEFQSTVDSVEGITMIINNPITMVSDTIYGNIGRTTKTSSVKEIYNNVHFINIPIAAGYSLNYDNWSFGVEAGALINILTKHKGQIRDSESSFYDMKTDDKNWFSDNVGVSFKAAILIGFSPADNFQILAGPNFRSPVKVSTAANPVQQEQSTLGFQATARYWLDY